MKIGVIGVGNMGEALVRGVHTAGGHTLLVYDVRRDHLRAVATRYGARPCATLTEAVAGAEVVLLAVKPQQMAAAMAMAAPAGGPETLWVSVAAGVTLASLRAGLLSERVVRVMPNTPALIGEGMICFATPPDLPESERDQIARLLAPLGRVEEVTEAQMDAVTGLSGSGPAYCLLIIEALAEAGVAEGLPAPLALELAAQTLRGAATLALESEDHPALLRQRVTSPGGTTARGLAALEAGGVRAALAAAVRAATARSRELGSGKTT